MSGREDEGTPPGTATASTPGAAGIAPAGSAGSAGSASGTRGAGSGSGRVVAKSGETVVPQPHGGALRPFVAGQSPNPAGRPKGISALVREQTREGAEVVEFMVAVLRGRRKAPLRLRMEAAAWLADRGFGKAPQPTELSGPEGAPLPLALVVREIVFELPPAAGAAPAPAREREPERVWEGVGGGEG